MSLIRHCSLRTFIREAKEILSLHGIQSSSASAPASSSSSSQQSSSWNHAQRVQARAREQGRLVLVIGNEGADLDSMSSALLYAYINTQEASCQDEQRWCESGDSTPTPAPVYIPLMNTRRADLRLRPEFLPVLARAGMNAVEELITVDDVLASGLNMDAAAEKITAEVVLVDENVLRGELASRFGEQISGVVDHHEVERKRARDVDKMRVWHVKQVGSCTSLVVQLCRGHWDQLREDEGERTEWDAEAASLALASVLIDTRCLDDENKTTEEDRRAVEYLEEKIRRRGGSDDNRFDKSAYFGEISTAKEDIGNLRVDEILRKDYKQWNETIEDKEAMPEVRLGISSVVKPIRFLSEKALTEERTNSEGYEEESPISAPLVHKLAQFATERKLSFYAAMTAFRSDSNEFQRELLLMATNHHASLEPAQKLEKEFGEELGLADWLNEDGKGMGGQWRRVDHVGLESFWWKLWRQTNINKSRKQVAPILRELLRTC